MDWAEGIQVLPKRECQDHQNVVGQNKIEILHTKNGVPKEAELVGLDLEADTWIQWEIKEPFKKPMPFKNQKAKELFTHWTMDFDNPFSDHCYASKKILAICWDPWSKLYFFSFLTYTMVVFGKLCFFICQLIKLLKI